MIIAKTLVNKDKFWCWYNWFRVFCIRSRRDKFINGVLVVGSNYLPIIVEYY